MPIMSMIICKIIGHKYSVSRIFSSYARQVKCKRCLSLWAMHDDIQAFLPWDSLFEEFYNVKEIE